MSDNIPFEIQAEIMKRLPVKSLIQFRSVSKQWKSVIDSSEFITDHSVNQTQPHHLLVMFELDSEYHFLSIVDDYTFPNHKFPPYVIPTVNLVSRAFMLDCSHGLVCLFGSHRYLDNNIIVLWNPSIRKSVGVLLPLESSVGFGVCPKTSDPKIVKITRVTPMDNWQAEVFTLSSRAWRSVPVNLPLPFKFSKYRSGQVVVDGVIYWFVYDLITKNHNRIVSFDLTSEEFGEVCLPDCLESPECLTISRLKESLVVVTYLCEDEVVCPPICDIWMMKKNGDLKSLITKLYISSEESDGSVGYEIQGFRKNGEPIMELMYHDGCVSSRLKVYDPCSKHIKDLGIDSSYESSFKMTSYSESLLLLNHPDSIIQS